MEGTVVASEQAPAGVELHDPEITVLVETDRRPAVRAAAARAERAAPDDPRPRRGGAAPPAPTRCVPARGRVGRRLPRRRSTPRGFIEIHTPKVVAAATESGANVFPVDWFGRRAFLAQSPQFYKQMMVGVFERVYEVGPVFRAEPHDTVRHLAEYVSLDAEIGFIRDHRDVMAGLPRRARRDDRAPSRSARPTRSQSSSSAFPTSPPTSPSSTSPRRRR